MFYCISAISPDSDNFSLLLTNEIGNIPGWSNSLVFITQTFLYLIISGVKVLRATIIEIANTSLELEQASECTPIFC